VPTVSTSTAPDAGYRLALSVDLEEWFHSRRWIDGQQAERVPDTGEVLRRIYGTPAPIGEVVPPTRRLLEIFAAHDCRVTFFVLGEIAQWYPDLIREIAAHGHEIASHGMTHVDIPVLGPERFSRELGASLDLLGDLTGTRPIGYRAPNLVYPAWATAILEEHGLVYDSSVCVSRPVGGKYKGWANAPLSPYRPSYDDIAARGDARIVEVPLPSFPIVNVAAGSSIFTRVIGYHWTNVALRTRVRTGDTAYYVHPWEFASRPRTEGNWLRNRIFLRRMGPWMDRTLGRILRTFAGRITTVGSVAARYTAMAALATGAFAA
jgi:peptidoglycan/xylan/chitin deacetylase (PgdA/CDA1 family)